jgi:translation initiation factor IF-1
VNDLKEEVLPQQGELLGHVLKLVRGDNIIVKCTDGKVRTCKLEKDKETYVDKRT